MSLTVRQAFDEGLLQVVDGLWITALPVVERAQERQRVALGLRITGFPGERDGAP